MGTVNRLIQSDYDRSMAAKLVENRPYPFTLTVTDGKPRSNAQNRLQHMWMKEISEQKGDVTAEEARAYCKLTIGVPILRSQNEAFKERYDEILKPLSYEQKLAIMSEPLNLPVTSLMSTKQLTEYLEAIIRHFGEQGIVLSMPDDLRDQFNSEPAAASPHAPADTGDAAPIPSPDAADGEAGGGSLAPSAATLTACAREMLAMAGLSYQSTKERDEAMQQCLEQWAERFPDNRQQMDDIFVGAKAVATKQRTVEQARSWLAGRLGCEPEEIGGQVNG